MKLVNCLQYFEKKSICKMILRERHAKEKKMIALCASMTGEKFKQLLIGGIDKLMGGWLKQ